MICRRRSPTDLLFFDPDNGLEVKSTRYGTSGSSRYLYWNEVEQAWTTGASLLVFQHFTREPRTLFVDRLSDELARRTGSPLVAAIRTSHVLFLFAGQHRHKVGFESATRFIERRWAQQAMIDVRISV